MRPLPRDHVGITEAGLMAETKGKILCVDDEPNIVRALQWLLQKEFEVITAHSGADALVLAGQHAFDVVISDQRMPVMTGVELLREIRKISPRTMRILLTGYSDYQAILRSVNESEVFRFINKPWNISELPRVVEQAVTISRTQAVPDEPVVSEDAPIVCTGERILLIDDDPATRDVLRLAVGNSVALEYASNLAEAVTILNEQPVAVIVSETKVGSIDATRLIRLMKQKHPEIVTVMFTGENDADTVTSLINQGQIYRFVPKPIRSGYLKLVINSALIKHQQLKETPALAARHAVQETAAGTVDTLMRDVNRVAAQDGGEVKARTGSAGDGMLGKIGGGFRRLFGI
jgi:serine/threonine-protein kinase